MTEITIGSLFSGSGGFELAASICGIKPVWASEIEPLPILVTKKNFPEMKHLGDIGYIKGDKIDPVTIISGGSPCQDMSIAGQRVGLDGDRSGLFRQQIRIVKEMRNSDIKKGRTGKDIRPRFMVWENVPGAFSSNRGGRLPVSTPRDRRHRRRNSRSTFPSEKQMGRSRMYHGRHFLHCLANA